MIQSTEYYPFGMPYAESTGQDVQPYKYNGKELDNMNGLNWYDYGFRHYDAALGRFTTVDPMAEKYYSLSPYVYCGNNPVARIDPDGMDWYYWTNKEKERMLQFDPKVTKDSELEEGQEYAGKTRTVKDKNGNVIANYRKDGSIVFSKESDGYKRIWDNTQVTGNEEMGVITDNGVLVLPSWDNNQTTAKLEEYGYSWKNENLQDPVTGESISTLATIHTHPGTGEAAKLVTITDDIQYFYRKTPNKPFFVMTEQGKKLDAYFARGRDGSYSYINLPTNSHGTKATVNNIANGKYSLIRILKHNRKQ